MSDVCSLADSPFSDGLGNDYLFVGNMVYTVRDCSDFYALFCLLPRWVLDYYFFYTHSSFGSVGPSRLV